MIRVTNNDKQRISDIDKRTAWLLIGHDYKKATTAAAAAKNEAAEVTRSEAAEESSSACWLFVLGDGEALFVELEEVVLTFVFEAVEVMIATEVVVEVELLEVDEVADEVELEGEAEVEDDPELPAFPVWAAAPKSIDFDWQFEVAPGATTSGVEPPSPWVQKDPSSLWPTNFDGSSPSQLSNWGPP